MRKLLVLLCSVLLCCSGLTRVTGATQPETIAWNPDDTAPMPDNVAAAAEHAKAFKCATPSCKAVITINQLMQIARFEMGDANGLASILGYDRPQIAGRRLDHVLLNHRHLFWPVCTNGARIISRFRFTPDVNDKLVPLILLINAVDMDLRNHGHCAGQLLASLPKDPVNDEVRVGAQELCANGFENHYRPKSACNVLIKGIKTQP